MRKFRGAVIVVLLAALQLSAFSAHAAGEFPVSGTVRNPLGEPIVKARVSDGVRTAWTAGDGSYRINESTPGTYVFAVTKSGFNPPPSVAVSAIDPRGVEGVDFVMTYSIQASGTPNSLNPSFTNQVAIKATSVVPSASCVTWRELSSGITIQLQPGIPESPVWPSTTPTNVWTGTYTLAIGTPEGPYDTETIATNCESGTLLTNIARFRYIQDSTVPEVGSAYPDGVASKGNLTFRLKDSLSGVDIPQSLYSVDDGAWKSPTGWDPWGGFARTDTPITGGLHTVRVHGQDRAGNTSDTDFTFFGDPTAPSIGDQTPTTSTPSNTPLIGVTVADESGINASSLKMRLISPSSTVEVSGPVGTKVTGGGRSQFVVASWDEATGRYEYQIPKMPSGTGVGDAPLLPGQYIVEVVATDNAGNSATFKWEFLVERPL